MLSNLLCDFPIKKGESIPIAQVCDFLQALVSSTNKTDCHNITGILLKEALSSITLSLTLE
jgi:hypothetical protein